MSLNTEHKKEPECVASQNSQQSSQNFQIDNQTALENESHKNINTEVNKENLPSEPVQPDLNQNHEFQPRNPEISSQTSDPSSHKEEGEVNLEIQPEMKRMGDDLGDRGVDQIQSDPHGSASQNPNSPGSFPDEVQYRKSDGSPTKRGQEGQVYNDDVKVMDDGVNGYHQKEEESRNELQKQLQDEETAHGNLESQGTRAEQNIGEASKETPQNDKVHISINMNEMREKEGRSDDQTNWKFQQPLPQKKDELHNEGKGNPQSKVTSVQTRSRPLREGRKRPSHFGFNFCHQCKRTESIDDLIKCRKEQSCNLFFCYNCIRKNKMKNAPEYTQHLTFPKTEFHKLKDEHIFLCLSCKGVCSCKECNQNSVFNDILKLQQDIGPQSQQNQNGSLPSAQDAAQSSSQSSKVVLQLQGFKPASKPGSQKTTPIPANKTFSSDSKAASVQQITQINGRQNLFQNLKVGKQPSQKESEPDTAMPQLSKAQKKHDQKQKETMGKLARKSKIQAMIATKNLYEGDDTQKEPQSAETHKPKVTSSGRPTKKPRGLQMARNIEDDIEDLEDDQEESDFAVSQKDEEYHINSDSNDSDCLNYDKIKKKLIKAHGLTEVPHNRVKIDRMIDNDRSAPIINENSAPLLNTQSHVQSPLQGPQGIYEQGFQLPPIKHQQQPTSSNQQLEEQLLQFYGQNNGDVQNKINELLSQVAYGQSGDKQTQNYLAQLAYEQASMQQNPSYLQQQLLMQQMQHMQQLDPYNQFNMPYGQAQYLLTPEMNQLYQMQGAQNNPYMMSNLQGAGAYQTPSGQSFNLNNLLQGMQQGEDSKQQQYQAQTPQTVNKQHNYSIGSSKGSQINEPHSASLTHHHTHHVHPQTHNQQQAQLNPVNQHLSSESHNNLSELQMFEQMQKNLQSNINNLQLGLDPNQQLGSLQHHLTGGDLSNPYLIDQATQQLLLLQNLQIQQAMNPYMDLQKQMQPLDHSLLQQNNQLFDQSQYAQLAHQLASHQYPQSQQQVPQTYQNQSINHTNEDLQRMLGLLSQNSGGLQPQQYQGNPLHFQQS